MTFSKILKIDLIMYRFLVFFLTFSFFVNSFAKDRDICCSGNAISLPNYNSSLMSQFCKDKWSKRGVLDKFMYDFCLEQNEDYYKDLKYTLSINQKIPGLDKILENAIQKWYRKWAWWMVSVEVNSHIEGYLDVQYITRILLINHIVH